MSALILPSRFTRQPQQAAKIDPAYAPYVAALMNGSSPNTYLGKFGFTEQSKFSSDKFTDSTSAGRTLSMNSSSVLGDASLLTAFQPTNKDFSFIGVIRVRGHSGAGVGIRSKGGSDTIILRRNGSNYSVRIAGRESSGGVMPLDTELNYVLTSNSSGVHLWVNGVEIINAAPTTSTTATGGDTSIYDDNYAGGSMDMDAALLVFLSKGISRQEAAALSRNPWAIYQVPPRQLWIDAGSVPVDPIYDLTGQNSQQVNTGSTNSITQTHALVGVNSIQSNIGTVGGISQTHLIAGANSKQANRAIVGSVSQAHVLAGSNSQQVNTASSGGVSQVHVLTGANSQQVNIGTGGAITQTAPEPSAHNLTGANSTQVNIGTGGAISHIHVLAGSNSQQTNAGATGAVSQVHALTGMNSMQLNIVVSGAIGQAHILTGANSIQINKGTGGAVTTGESVPILPNKINMYIGQPRIRTITGSTRIRSLP